MRKLHSVGIMTGTSADGADFALIRCIISGNIREEWLAGCSFEFPKSLRTRILAAQSGKISVAEYGRLTRDFSLWLVECCDKVHRRWNLKADNTILGVHGQTVWHEPPARSPSFKKPGFSVQMVDASLVAQRTGLVTVANFRQPDLALGGQGAPLVPYYHWLLAAQGYAQLKPPIAIHNIGGISNLTYVPARLSDIQAFDTGPGNALIDLAVAKVTRGQKMFDQAGAMARKGKIDWEFLYKLAKHRYFLRQPPKSTGRELFNEEFLENFSMTGADLVANTTAFTALTMAQAYARFLVKKRKIPRAIFVAGGGARNTYLLELFSRVLKEESGQKIPVKPLADNVVSPQYLEATAFARLAVEAVLGRSVTLKEVTGAKSQPIGAALYQADNYEKIISSFGPGSY